MISLSRLDTLPTKELRNILISNLKESNDDYLHRIVEEIICSNATYHLQKYLKKNIPKNINLSLKDNSILVNFEKKPYYLIISYPLNTFGNKWNDFILDDITMTIETFLFENNQLIKNKRFDSKTKLLDSINFLYYNL